MSVSYRSELLFVLLAFCFACILGCSKPEVRLEINSIPSGAVIWLNHAPTTQRTPAEISFSEDAVISVRLEGYKASPLALQVLISDPPKVLHFDFVKRDDLTSPEALSEDLPALQEVAPLSLDAPPTKTPSAAEIARVSLPNIDRPQKTYQTKAPLDLDRKHKISLSSWDPLFSIKINGEGVLHPKSRFDLPEGPQHIQVKLNTFELLDSLLLEPGQHFLPLPSLDSFVEIHLDPADAELVSGSLLLGQGRCLIPRFLLPLNVSFEALPGYLQPAPIQITKESSNRHFSYEKEFSFTWSEGSIRLEKKGYRFPDQDFVIDDSNGPTRMNGSLLFTKAFKSRRPSGVQAAHFVFDLPEQTHNTWPATLELQIGDSQKRVFGSFRNRATMSLLINGTFLVRDVTIEEKIETKSWPISKLITPGQNTLEVRTSERALSRLRLDAISLRISND